MLVVLDRLGLGAHVFQRADQKAAGAAGRVQHDLADLRVHHIGHELGDGARRVVFAGIARALQVAQDLLIDVVEEMALLHVVEVDAVDAVDDLAHQRAGLHVVVRVGEDLMHDHATRVAAGADGQFLSVGKSLLFTKSSSSSPVMPSSSAAQLRQRNASGMGER